MDFCLCDLQKEFLLEFCMIEIRETVSKTPATEQHQKDATRAVYNALLSE